MTTRLTLAILAVGWALTALFVAAWVRAATRPYYQPLPRHRDPAICHAPGCRWTPAHSEDCDCWPTETSTGGNGVTVRLGDNLTTSDAAGLTWIVRTPRQN